MPSTRSSVVSKPFASSTVITPSFPTLSIASARMSPMVLSLLAEIVPTCAISSRSRVGLDIDLSSSTTLATALSMPRLMLMGSWPAATNFSPSLKIARANTVAVVVPSPATSEVLLATSLTIWAPIFSNLSSSWISFATETPSFVTVGEPQDFSRTTLRPLGPKVTVTASASRFTPRRTRLRASSLNRISFAAISISSLFHDSKDVIFTHYQMLLAVQLDLCSGILSKENFIARLYSERYELPVFVFARTHRNDLPLLRFLLGRVRDDDTSLGFLFLLNPFHNHPIM